MDIEKLLGELNMFDKDLESLENDENILEGLNRLGNKLREITRLKNCLSDISKKGDGLLSISFPERLRKPITDVLEKEIKSLEEEIDNL